MPLTTEIYASIRAKLTSTPDLGSVAATLAASVNRTLASGTSADKADLVWADTRTLAGNGADNLDLAGGSLVDAIGTALTFVKVKGILVANSTASLAALVIGNGTNPFIGPFGSGTHTVSVAAGGCAMLVAPSAGWTVTASTADILKITNGAGGSSTYDIIVFGTSA